MSLVAGVDTSTQACKIVVRDAATGELVRSGRAAHPDGTEIDPEHWWTAFRAAEAEAGGLDDVAAIAVGGQQHGMVCLDGSGAVVRPALLWNDTRSAPDAAELVDELGGPQAWVDATGLVPVASFTVTKLRWLASHEPANAARTAAVCLPHDWLTWRIGGFSSLDALRTDRGDASGTGYFSPSTDAYRLDLIERALGHVPHLPQILGPSASGGTLPSGALLGPGTGDNMAAALGVGARAGDVVVSIGTSGVVSAVSATPTADPSGTVAGFASASGDFLPLVCTLNAARVLDATARMLGVDHERLSSLALSAPAGSDGLVVVPYLEGERTPNKPDSTGAVHGLTLTSSTPAHLARATIEGLLCGLADGLDALITHGVDVRRVILVGGGAKSAALRQIAPAVLGYPVFVPPPGEYVADGAARQAAWTLAASGDASAEEPSWAITGLETYEADALPFVRARYAEVRDLTARQV